MPKKKSPSKRARARVRNPPTLKNCRIAVVGLNALGYRIAQLLVVSGVDALKLVDHRLVTKRDQLRDGYDAIDIGRPKAHAAVQRCHEINPRIEITGHAGRSEPDLSGVDVVFVCGNATRPDHRDANAEAWVHILFTASIGLSVRIEALRTDKKRKSSRLHCPADASIVAGIVVGQFTKWRAGDQRRRTQRIDIDALTIRITARPQR